MFKDANIMFMYTESSLHCGSGSSLGVVDLPIQREKYTDYPVCQASGIKGAMREWFEMTDDGSNKDKITYTFGPDFERGDGEAFAGAATFTDGRLLLFPVRSLNGVFAYTTSRFALSRLKRDAEMAGVKGMSWDIPVETGEKALGAKGNSVGIVAQDKIVLEEYTYDFEENDDVAAIAKWIAKNAIPKGQEYDNYWRKKAESDIVILPDEIFRDFVKLSTEVQARIRINNETKTVDHGALFYEEALSSDSLLYSVVMAHDPVCDKNKRPSNLKDYKDVMAFLSKLDDKRLQLGGDITIGKGIVKLTFLNGGT